MCDMLQRRWMSRASVAEVTDEQNAGLRTQSGWVNGVKKL
jgi:hypothetical protein